MRLTTSSQPADYCPTCDERTALTDKGICPWCDSPLEVKPRRGGWKRPDRKARMTEAHLRALYRVYIERGESINQLAKRVHGRLGYKSHHSAAVAMSEGWKRLGLPARDRIDAVKLACTVHGMAPKHGPRPGYGTYRRRLKREDQPRCAAVKAQPPGKGNPCRRPAMLGSEYCVSHDPRRELERQANLAKMRRRQPRPDMLPIEPFAEWLQALVEREGSMRAVAGLLDAPYTALCQYAKCCGTDKQPKATIGRGTVRRYASAAGVAVEAIYPGEEVLAA